MIQSLLHICYKRYLLHIWYNDCIIYATSSILVAYLIQSLYHICNKLWNRRPVSPFDGKAKGDQLLKIGTKTGWLIQSPYILARAGGGGLGPRPRPRPGAYGCELLWKSATYKIELGRALSNITTSVFRTKINNFMLNTSLENNIQ